MIAIALVSALAWACGGTIGSNGDAGSDAGAVVDPDAGAADAMDEPPVETYPADFGAPPRVIASGGPVLKNFSVIPVFYANDPLQAQVEQFLKALPSTPYWEATTKEYGATTFTVGDSIVIADPAPSKIDDTEIQTWLGAQTDGTHMGWPSSNDQTLFALFYPQSTSITLDGTPSCQGFGAYHNSAVSAGVADFPYAIMPRCGGGLDTLTVSTSHELVEAATDPFPMVKPAYQRIDNDHIVWMLAGGGETADLCEFDRTASQRLVGNFLVQRSWSNASIKAGHDPCVPALSGAFFAAVPVLGENVQLTYNGQKFVTKGVKIPLGTSKTIDVKLFSDAPKDAWTVSAADRTSGFGNAGYVTFSWDKTTGRNGDILQLTINAVKQSPMNGAIISISSTDGAMVRHRWLGAVGF